MAMGVGAESRLLPRPRQGGGGRCAGPSSWSPRAADALTRAEAAGDLGSLGTDAADAAGDLSKLLDDPAPAVRLAAAAALLASNRPKREPWTCSLRGWRTGDNHTSCGSPRGGTRGSAAGPLAGKLGALLKDPDVCVRRTALQAIATLGPAAAAATDSVPALTRGAGIGHRRGGRRSARIGPAARPALKALAHC